MTRDTITFETSIVYVLTTPSMPGLVKIGWTSRTAQARAAELHTTGVPEPFEIEVAYRVPNGSTVERALHEVFKPYRRREDREFFEIEPYQVEAILHLLGTEAGAEDVTVEVDDNPGLIPNEIIQRRSRRPRADFLRMGIPVGDEITCVRYGAVARIAGRRTVIFEGKEVSLSAASAQIMPHAMAHNFYR
ncbi:GIY-YIG nuclease family protein [Methylobacterium sp. 77]|uniref:GIY-YIG nuclease family protein n=1 Tax=Methylobacterium sp. 77 TaxID=1101192 RepID=UPI0009DC2F91|nr:GIY-YIG nuclease family protein [Methylobacterium sp. 77]